MRAVSKGNCIFSVEYSSQFNYFQLCKDRSQSHCSLVSGSRERSTWSIVQEGGESQFSVSSGLASVQQL